MVLRFHKEQDADQVQAMLDTPAHDELAGGMWYKVSVATHEDAVKDQEVRTGMDGPQVAHMQSYRDADDETPMLFSSQYFDLRDVAREVVQVVAAETETNADAGPPTFATNNSYVEMDDMHAGVMKPGTAGAYDLQSCAPALYLPQLCRLQRQKQHVTQPSQLLQTGIKLLLMLKYIWTDVLLHRQTRTMSPRVTWI